ncbi:ATP-dependent 6-phosphofructokinase, partial [Chloroflexota bacterium]
VKVIGIHEGFEGLIHGDMEELTARSVGGILQRGGTILQTARSEEFRTTNGQREAIRQMNENEIDGLVVAGGDGSLNGALALAEKGVKVIGVPASIDNDIWGTNMSIGVDTAMNTILMAVDRLRDTASSHNRAFLIEVMGRNCGYLAVMAGIIGGAEMVLIPEVDVELEEVAEAIESAYTRGKNHSIVIMAEGANIRAQALKEKLDDLDVGFRTRVTILGHIQRGGSPTAFDRMLATRLGVKAAEALIEEESGKMAGLRGQEVELIPLEEVVKRSRKVNMEYYDLSKMLVF